MRTSQVVSLKKLAGIRRNLKVTVLAGGVFDIIHPGHIEHLKKAKSLGGTLIVHVTGDKRVKEKKGNSRPIFSQKERAYMVSAIKFVDFVFIYNGRHYDQKVIDAIRPDILIFNEEAFTEKVSAAVKSLNKFNGKVFVSKQKKTNSSSDIIKKLIK